ncbi:endonuclease/exonuclease/phosphatase family protein [Luteipulveratus mongoliensis]|uniref:endonuclease/exonuclease/phosphatase family protein n=1 Tax=Luteipulveratus mongoliensis TaxID=571913 RepID=UPI000696916F|nr:endonuclease/exonuclease/phosphatase family protein [Luteipulveratus mongoliensis]
MQRSDIVRWAVMALLVVAGIGVFLRWYDGTGRVPVAQSVFPVFGLLAFMLVIATAVMRERRLVVVALVIALLPAILAFRAMRSDTVAAGPRDEVVMASNMEYGAADPATIVATVRERKVTSLVLVEVTPEGWRRLRVAGLGKLLPNMVGTPRAGADGTVICSSRRLKALESAHVPPRFDQPVAEVQAPGGRYVLRAAHPYPPVPDLVHGWHDQLGELATWRAKQPRDVPLVIAGDFNASSAHPAFRHAAETMTDAHRATGSGWVRTWPRDRRTPPFVQIDHVLVRKLGVVDAGVVSVPDTDHAAIWARLRIGVG